MTRLLMPAPPTLTPASRKEFLTCQTQISFTCLFYRLFLHFCLPSSEELRTQKLRFDLRTQSAKVLPLKHGVDQYIALQATPTAMNFFLANFYISGSFTFTPPKKKNLSRVFPVLAVANASSSVDRQCTVGHLAPSHRRLMQGPC